MVPPGTIAGTVTRDPNLVLGTGGKGTLWVDIGSTCPYQGQINVANTIMEPNVDISSPNASVHYEMTGVAPGTYFVWGWLDANGDGQPFPSGGDPFDFPNCVQVTLTASTGATADLLFNSTSN